MLRHKVAAHTRQYQSKHHHEHHYSGPFFEGPLNTSAGALNVGVHLHTEGVFDCRVGMLKDKTVSSEKCSFERGLLVPPFLRKIALHEFTDYY